ncbi:MAG TPA: cysteine desulfurase family protein [Patescibacteria group bacterium]|nr:cysteine desulfurase family protein [Patescibacteria group bacterium]
MKRRTAGVPPGSSAPHDGGGGRGLVYLMHSTTTPLDPEVRQVMTRLLNEDPRDPEGLLADGRRIAGVIEAARRHVADLVGADANEIIFTSGGTESCNLAVKGVALARLAQGGRPATILVAATEHTSVLYPARTLGRLGFEVREVPVDHRGTVALDALTDMLGANTVLVSVALATAETGTLQPIAEIARIVHERGALLHVDACLAAGYQRVDLRSLDADLASFSAHKLRGPRGCGALYAREGVRITPLIEGGVNEGGRRGGAECVAGIAGFGEAARLAAAGMPSDEARLSGLGVMLEESLTRVAAVTLNGHPARRLRGLVNLSVAGVDGEALLLRLARQGIAASSGSTCFQQTGKPSHVLLAMGVPARLAQSSILFSVGRDTTVEEIHRVIEHFPPAVESLRALSVEPQA